MFDTISTLSSALPTERNARLAVPFGSITRGHARTDPDVDVPTFPAYDIAGAT